MRKYLRGFRPKTSTIIKTALAHFAQDRKDQGVFPAVLRKPEQLVPRNGQLLQPDRAGREQDAQLLPERAAGAAAGVLQAKLLGRVLLGHELRRQHPAHLLQQRSKVDFNIILERNCKTKLVVPVD